MPIELRRTVTRRCADPYNHRGRKLVVSLEPGDVISFREERGRTRFSAPLAKVFQQIVRWNVESQPQKRKRGARCVR